VRDASIMLGRTKERGKRSEGCLAYARQDKRRRLGMTIKRSLGKTRKGCSAGQMGSKGIADSKGRFSSTAENVFQQHRIGETG